ncbi:hypothetical protein AgCh_028446 [Apium graveolens]
MGMQRYLKTEGKTLSENQLVMLLWEERLYEEINRVCGSDRITEAKLPQLPFLYAIFQETVRFHCPVPIIPYSAGRVLHSCRQRGALEAMTISRVAIGRLIQEFEWRLTDGQIADVDTVGLTSRKLHPHDGNPKSKELSDQIKHPWMPDVYQYYVTFLLWEPP